MSRPSHRVMRALAGAIDDLKADREAEAIPAGYEVNIVLRNKADPSAHIFVGESNPRDLADAISELIDNPDQTGIVNASGVKIEI